ncbi:MAG TPA: CRISPR system precrRNA processing endoribonuclease RAMP protein Cas6 [Thermotogota bacterium]|nr:CRISPR system precrRNA processing endoribonuclease RAMP protein Cas6 [Thermotogota bacterium]
MSFFAWLREEKGFEFRVNLCCRKTATITNPSERLHGAILATLSAEEPSLDLHPSNKRVSFSLSTLLSPGAGFPREFGKGQRYFFRFAGWGKELANVFSAALAFHPVLNLAGVEFDVTGLEEKQASYDSFANLPNILNLHFLTPVTFRIDKKVNLPFPAPEQLAASLGKLLDDGLIYPPLLRRLEGKTRAIHFSRHVLVGYCGSIQIETPFPQVFAFLHFLGTGYSTARGMGNTIVREVQPDLSFYGLRARKGEKET